MTDSYLILTIMVSDARINMKQQIKDNSMNWNGIWHMWERLYRTELHVRQYAYGLPGTDLIVTR